MILGNLNKCTNLKYIQNLKKIDINLNNLIKLNKRNFIISSEENKKEIDSKQQNTISQLFNYQENSQFNESRIIIYTRKLNFDENDTILLYKSEFSYQDYFKSLFFNNKGNLWYVTSFILTTGLIFNFKLAILLFIPYYFKYGKKINLREKLNTTFLLIGNRIVTEIYLDRSLSKVIYILKNNVVLVKKITDNLFISKEMAFIGYEFFDNLNHDYTKIIYKNFLLSKNNHELLFISFDAKIYDKELFAHVLKGRIIVTPEVPEVFNINIATKKEGENFDYNTEEFQKFKDE